MERLIVIQSVDPMLCKIWCHGKPFEAVLTANVPGHIAKILGVPTHEPPTPPEPVYRVGQRFMHVSGCEYILAVAGGVDNAVLVNLKTGCNFSGSKYVRDYDAITAAEFAQICAGKPSDFMLIEGEI